jgi:acetyl esterase/lipase
MRPSAVTKAMLLLSAGIAAVVCAQRVRPGGDVTQHLQRFDRNGDGVLTRDELDQPGLFRRLDANGDGLVTKAELKGPRRAKAAPARRVTPTHADVRYGPHERNVFDLYLAESREPAPLLIFIHGGGFVGGDKRQVQPNLVGDMRRNGISVAALNYRFITTDPMPACYHDAARALQFLRAHAADYNVDPKRFACTGGSAGAGISLWLAFHDDMTDPEAKDPVLRESSRILCAQVGGAQVSYDPRFWRQIGLKRGLEHRSFPHMYGRREGEDEHSPRLIALYEECAPITHVSRDDPPVYLTYGVTRDVSPETPMNAIIHHPLHGLALQERVKPFGIECIVVYKGGPEPPMSAAEFLIHNLRAGHSGKGGTGE